MSNTPGQTCPHCQLPFTPGDNYVVCSQCGIALHQACWEANQHCTTSGCQGQAVSYQLSPTTAMAPPPMPPIAPTYQQTQSYPQAALALYPKAPLFSRFLASVVDGLIAGVPLLPGLVLIGLRSTETIGALFTLVAVVWCLFYAYTKDGRPGGQSIGKRMNDLMVVHLPTNTPCTKGQSAVRMLIMQLTGFVPFIGGFIEPVMVLVTSQGTRLGDRVAKTQVIDVRNYRRCQQR